MRGIKIKRIGRAVITDIKFQWKHGFFLIYGIVSFIYLIILSQLPHSVLDYALPIIVFSDPSILGLFFIGGMVLLEKEQGVLQLLAVTPLTIKEYIISKICSLMLIALMASLLITVMSTYKSVNYFVLILGIVFTSAFFTLVGIMISTKAKNVNAFFLYMLPWSVLLIVPCVFYILYPHLKILLLLPSVSGLSLVFGAIPIWKTTFIEIIFAFVYMTVINYFLFKIATSIFHKKMV